MKTPYDDIISLPHHVSRVHPQMPMYTRAAQFAPFAALSGHEAAISETARQTDTERELADSEAEMLDRKFAVLLQKKIVRQRRSGDIREFAPRAVTGVGDGMLDVSPCFLFCLAASYRRQG